MAEQLLEQALKARGLDKKETKKDKNEKPKFKKLKK